MQAFSPVTYSNFTEAVKNTRQHTVKFVKINTPPPFPFLSHLNIQFSMYVSMTSRETNVTHYKYRFGMLILLIFILEGVPRGEVPSYFHYYSIHK